MDNVKVYNLNIANTAGNVGQALAVDVYQETVLTDKDLELYTRTYINGAIDFVFGCYVQAWFEPCDIGIIDNGTRLSMVG
ncbi:hypothetical protein DD237_002298 [Peronospora effusa]|uniref:Pectinesterase n=1 Tax=Peronospora effusa TaxID=542832 RepID=A0A425BZL7_9STRA|nr:hypothetical protein DD237_002298 [Peronospora effusa]